MHARRLPSAGPPGYRAVVMRLLGRCLAVVAAVTMDGAFRRLRTDLVSVYSAYRASLRSRLPPVVVEALVAAEDRGFRRHAGAELVPALWMLFRLAAARRPGRRASLEQRLVRLLTGRSPRRVADGLRELLLASLVGRVVPKADVPGLYLFVAYFGWRMNGIREACSRLGFAVATLTPLQAASVVARLRYPEPPVLSDERARQIAMRARRILRLLEQEAVPRPPASEPGPAWLSAAPAGTRPPAASSRGAGTAAP
jgi:penicillin-binding protein 1A